MQIKKPSLFCHLDIYSINQSVNQSIKGREGLCMLRINSLPVSDSRLHKSIYLTSNSYISTLIYGNHVQIHCQAVDTFTRDSSKSFRYSVCMKENCPAPTLMTVEKGGKKSTCLKNSNSKFMYMCRPKTKPCGTPQRIIEMLKNHP